MPHIERLTVEFRIVYKSLRRLLVGAFMLIILGGPTTAQELTGVWLSPDWFFPGDHRYSEAEVRRTARSVMEKLSTQGVDTVFLETFLRGYGICPSIDRDDRAKTASVIPYNAGKQGHPVYPHLQWNYAVEFDTVIDPLQIFIEEGQLKGIEVHAWVHMFYWRMDNNDIMLPWHNGPSLWGRLMEEYLEKQAERLAFIQDSSVRPGYEQVAAKALGDDVPVEMLQEAADLFAQGCDTNQLETLLDEYDYRSNGHPMGVLIAEIIKSGGQRPDFVLMAGDQEPFPAPRSSQLRSVYVDPENPAVRRQLEEAVINIAQTHPGLAGVHLDHIRYPVDGQGLTPDTGVLDGKYRYFNASNPQEMREYDILTRTLKRRQDALTGLVSDIAKQLPRRMKLSAAVLPLYYRDRDNGKFRTSGYDYPAQAWLDWPVDFVVPMMYEYHPYLIRTLIEDYQTLAYSANPQKPIQVYPGISRLSYTRNGSVKSDGWVFFDLSLARDVKNPRQEAEDLDFGGE